MAATIKDVARLAEVSIKTVSRVINAEPHVNEETRVRVLSAVRAVGYAPNISARRLVQNKAYSICILINPGFFQPASAILNTARGISDEENYDILIQPFIPTHPRSRDKLVSLIYERRMDGFVTTPPCDAEEFVADLLDTFKVPLVQINPFQRSEQIPSVAGDDRGGAVEMMTHLVQLGHRRIGFLMGPQNMRASADRLEGYKLALDTFGLAFDPALVISTDFTFQGGHQAAYHLLRDPIARPSAIFAGNDEAAYGAIYAAQELGIAIPEGVSIAGFDDLAMSGQIWPGLTTIHQPAEELVEIATRQLIQKLKNRPGLPVQVLVPSRLVIRRSTGPLLA